jgi:biopolymer transport protein TolR
MEVMGIVSSAGFSRVALLAEQPAGQPARSGAAAPARPAAPPARPAGAPQR